MKKLISIALLLLMLSIGSFALMPTGAAEDFEGWTPISSGADFAKITSGTAASPNKYYLTKDITVDATIGSGWNPAPISNVIIDGNGKTITQSKSLFARVDNFTMQNVTLDGKIVWNKEPFMKSPITSGNGNTCGKITLTNVTSDVDMEMCFNHRFKRFAGVIYYTGAGSVLTNVKYTGSITVKGSSSIDAKIEVVGGIVATATGTSFENCSNEGSILIENGVTPGLSDGGSPITGCVGGIVGGATDCALKNCTNAANVNIEAEAGRYTSSGIAGMVAGATVLESCKNSGALNISNCTDGIVPCLAYGATLVDCENTGEITISYKKVDAVEGSCSEKGVREHYLCIFCLSCFDENGELLESGELVLDYAHSLGELIELEVATCLHNGMDPHYVCSACGNYFDENKQKTTEFALTRVAGHNYVFVELVEAKPGEEGMKAHYECSVCKKLFDENKTEVDEESLKIPALPPVETDPAATDPEVTEPAATEPEATEPEATEPAATEPAATEPEKSGGCSSSFCGATVICISVLGAAVLLKKKEKGGN